MAVLDAVLSPSWESRYFSFDRRWAPTEELASMRDGCGNEYSIVFTPAGAFARGFDHESPLSPYRLDPAAVQHVYALRPLTRAVVSRLNPDLDLHDLTDDLTGIGYPSAE
jgi:hypothetical protein